MSTSHSLFIPAEDSIVLKDPLSVKIHGAVFVDPYLIGTPRGGPNLGLEDEDEARVVRIHKNDYSTYDAVLLEDPNNPGTVIKGMEDAVYAPSRNRVYSHGVSEASGGWIVEINPLSDPFDVQAVASTPSGVEALATDGDFLYGAGNELWKWDLEDFSLQASAAYDLGGDIHSMILASDGYLYGIGSSNALAADTVLIGRIDPSDLSTVTTAPVGQCTDDMAEIDDWIFAGPEEATEEAGGFPQLGYDWGAVAIRKSDMAVFHLPWLPGETGVIVAFGVFVRGNKLFIQKTNRRTYVIDLGLHPPDTWSDSSDTNQVVTHYYGFIFEENFTAPDQSGTLVANELMMDSEGRLHAFAWPNFDSDGNSGAFRWEPEGLSLVPEPGTVAGVARLDGSPLEGASVQAVDPAALALSAVTDALGDYTLSGLDPAKTYHVFVEHAGHVALSQPGVTGLSEISGRVTRRNAEPVEGATVYAVESSGADAEGTGLEASDAQGDYAVRLLESGATVHMVAEDTRDGEPYAAISKPGVVVP